MAERTTASDTRPSDPPNQAASVAASPQFPGLYGRPEQQDMV